MVQSWNVLGREAGTKLLPFLRSKLGETYSARQLKRAIEANLCIVNGLVERFATYKLKTGDAVKFDSSALQSIPPPRFEISNERILYEDECLFIYNKPVGITSDKTGMLLLLPGMFLIHRLDRETTGAIIFAKSEKMQKQMISLFRQKGVGKVYLALVDGIPKRTSGVIEKYLGKVSQSAGQTLWGVVRPNRGRCAKTLWRCQKKGKDAALLRCVPETGRTHQIRIHMKEIGHPILGDYRYVKKYNCSFHAKRCMLHALEIAFQHPGTGKMLKVKAPIPGDFKEAMKKVI